MKKLLILIMISFLTANVSLAASDINITKEDGIYHVILSGDKIKKKIKFVSSEGLITNREAHQKAKARLTVNAGFFDPANQKTISYIVTDKQISADPLFNDNLMRNPFLRQNIDKVMNRTEFRVVECDRGKVHYEITPHKGSVDFGCTLLTSAQGGPLVYPELRLEEELFIVKKDGEVVRESCSVLHKTARTIIGLKGEEVHLLLFTDEHPVDMYEVQAYCKKLDLDRAMGFDGGSSTSLNYLNKYEVTSTGDGGGRSLKSFMLVY